MLQESTQIPQDQFAYELFIDGQAFLLSSEGELIIEQSELDVGEGGHDGHTKRSELATDADVRKVVLRYVSSSYSPLVRNAEAMQGDKRDAIRIATEPLIRQFPTLDVSNFNRNFPNDISPDKITVPHLKSARTFSEQVQKMGRDHVTKRFSVYLDLAEPFINQMVDDLYKVAEKEIPKGGIFNRKLDRKRLTTQLGRYFLENPQALGDMMRAIDHKHELGEEVDIPKITFGQLLLGEKSKVPQTIGQRSKRREQVKAMLVQFVGNDHKEYVDALLENILNHQITEETFASSQKVFEDKRYKDHPLQGAINLYRAEEKVWRIVLDHDVSELMRAVSYVKKTQELPIDEQLEQNPYLESYVSYRVKIDSVFNELDKLSHNYYMITGFRMPRDEAVTVQGITRQDSNSDVIFKKQIYDLIGYGQTRSESTVVSNLDQIQSQITHWLYEKSLLKDQGVTTSILRQLEGYNDGRYSAENLDESEFLQSLLQARDTVGAMYLGGKYERIRNSYNQKIRDILGDEAKELVYLQNEADSDGLAERLAAIIHSSTKEELQIMLQQLIDETPTDANVLERLLLLMSD